jgi:nicotinate-nucleotide pyrophosphorylase (carboxylating)
MAAENEKEFTQRLMQDIISLALEEDKVTEDVTTNALEAFDREVTARVTAKEDGIISGAGVFKEVFLTVDPNVKVAVLKSGGSCVKKGDPVFVIKGNESSILKAERTALNFLQRLSGIATLTAAFAEQLKPHPVTLLDTRKTTPGMRYLEKQAVIDGGGANHRLNLEDMAMVKDNHVKMAGSITNAVKAIKQKYPGKKIEAEVRNIEELEEALALEVDMIMLDNFSPAQLQEAVKRKRGSAAFEVSGNVTLETIASRAAEGIDFISVGALTHSFRSLDLSLNIED